MLPRPARTVVHCGHLEDPTVVWGVACAMRKRHALIRSRPRRPYAVIEIVQAGTILAHALSSSWSSNRIWLQHPTADWRTDQTNRRRPRTDWLPEQWMSGDVVRTPWPEQGRQLLGLGPLLRSGGPPSQAPGRRKCTIFAMGIMPYISASIILQPARGLRPEPVLESSERNPTGRRESTSVSRTQWRMTSDDPDHPHPGLCHLGEFAR